MKEPTLPEVLRFKGNCESNYEEDDCVEGGIESFELKGNHG